MLIRRPDGNEVTAYLDNAYREWRSDPGDQEALFARYRAALTSAPERERSPLRAEQIVPVVRHRTYLEQILAASKDDASKAPTYELLNEEMVVFYVADTPEAMRYLHEDELAAVQFTPEVRRQKALENLRGLLDEVSLRGGNGIFMLVAGGSYESSLLLSDNLWSSDILQVRGELVVAVPSRDLVLVTGSEDVANLARVREIVAQTEASGAYLISTRLFVRRHGAWAVWP